MTYPGNFYLEKREGEDKKNTVKLAIVGLERYVLTSEEGLPIAARRGDRDCEQNLGMIEGLKDFKERRRYMRSNTLKQKKLHE